MSGGWAFANLGVPVALAVGFLGYLLTQAGAVRRQEARSRSGRDSRLTHLDQGVHRRG